VAIKRLSQPSKELRMNGNDSFGQGPLVQIVRFLAVVGIVTIFGFGVVAGLFLADLYSQLAAAGF
jgi:hypothetical protein